MTATPAPSDNSDASGMSLSDLSKTQVVYSASKSEQKTTDAPGTTTIITSSEIKAGGFRTLDDLLNYVRGFYVTYDRDYSYLGLRGFGSLGGYNCRVLLEVDSHRINDNVYGQFYTGEDAMIDMEMLDHVEIIRGPASVLYGSSAVFGVINLVTKRGKDVNGLVLSAQGGNLDTLGGGALYGRQDDSGFQWCVEGSGYYSGGYADLYFPEYNDPISGNVVNNGIAHNADGEAAQHGFLSLSKDEWSFEAAVMHRYKVVPTGVFGTLFNDNGTHTDDLNMMGELNFRSGDPESGQWNGRLYADVSDYWGRYVSATTGVPNNDAGEGAWAGADLHFTFIPLERNKITLGGEFVDNFQQLQQNYDDGVLPYYLDDNRQSTELAFYLQDEFKLFPNLLLTAGGRYDYFSTTKGQLLPRGALIWGPWPT
ncbi:MAG TPA: TonB-dependent receptor, partial [bacterium]|nr:TonB-dependent receptor [bacterium]